MGMVTRELVVGTIAEGLYRVYNHSQYKDYKASNKRKD